MKKMYCFLILVIMFLPVVNAGKTFGLDFNTKDNYPLIMKEGDRVLFEYGGYNHTIILENIKNKTTELDVFLFLEAGPHTPNYAYINDNYDIKLDFDKDGKKEIAIQYIDSDSITKKIAIVFKKLEAWDKDAKLSPLWKSKNDEANEIKKISYFWYYIAGGIIIILLIIAFITIFNKKEDGTYF